MTRERPSSVLDASAASARRAAALLVAQLIALAALSLVAIHRGCGSSPALPVDAVAPPPPDAGRPPLDAAEPPCADATACSAACHLDGGPAAIEACVRNADMLRSGKGGATRDRVAARGVYRAVCFQTLDAVACTRLALDAGLLHDLDLAPDWLDPERAPLALLAGACSTGEARGELACAALELIDADAGLARAARSRLCRARPGLSADECAAAVAWTECQIDNAEACFLAAKPDLSTTADARVRLDALCTAIEPDPPACVYHYARLRDEKSLIAACAELDSVRTGSLATACLERARLVEPRRTELVERACKLGACQAPDLVPAVPVSRNALDAACRNGELNGCAVLIFTDRANPSRLRTTLDRVAAHWPEYAAYTKLGLQEADLMACQLGALAGCKLAIKRLETGAATRDRAAALTAYSRLLAAPLEVGPSAWTAPPQPSSK